MIKHYLYIITNKPNGVLYIGITKDLKRRIYQHKNKSHSITFSAKYNLNKIVYFEVLASKEKAILREKQTKKWNRRWKIELIEENNSKWIELYDNL